MKQTKKVARGFTQADDQKRCGLVCLIQKHLAGRPLTGHQPEHLQIIICTFAGTLHINWGYASRMADVLPRYRATESLPFIFMQRKAERCV